MQNSKDILKFKNDHNLYNLSEKSFNAINNLIDLAKHYLFIDKKDKALEILKSIGFTKKSIDSFIVVASTELEVDFSNDTRLLLKEKISKKYLN
tara:strand:- start:1043 stop:1324 length:282 start_codon:yes stop_codon:yes gene_type:complete